jgi:phosphatidylserine/phosphatidylglycerophosphate/cardiolipin synthase-like enzyme
LRDAGVAVRFDASLDHMHHKFAVFDRRLVVTGSYNWTRSAAENNHENILITGQARLVQAFHDEFERLWAVFPVQPSTENV